MWGCWYKFEFKNPIDLWTLALHQSLKPKILLNIVSLPWQICYCLRWQGPSLLTCILSAITIVLQSYCATSYPTGGLNQMWILNNSKDLLEYIKYMPLSFCNTIKAFDNSTLYTNISHSKLKDILKELVQLYFLKKNDQRGYKYLVLGMNISYFVKKKHSDSIKNSSEIDIINMLEFLDWQHICYVWWTYIWVQTALLFSTTCSFIRMRQTSYRGSQEKWKEDRLCLSLLFFTFCDFVDRIYHIEFDIQYTTDTNSAASYIDVHITIESQGQLRTNLYDKRNDFNFPVVYFPFICSNISAAPAYGVYISQLIRYSRACGSYQDFLDRGLLLAAKVPIG